MTLLSLASRQIWPQVLSVLHLRPDRLILFHSSEEAESKQPAERLRNLFNALAIIPRGIRLETVPHDHFGGLMDGLARVAESETLDDSNSRLNLTGGNKLMAMAAAEWCRLNGVPCFYLERDFRVFPFQPIGTDLQPHPSFALSPNLAKDIDPIALLRCQLSDAEIVSAGEQLTLSDAGRVLDERALSLSLRQGIVPQFEGWLHRRSEGVVKDGSFGDGLELLTAAVLLHLGVPRVQRGVRLRSGTGRTHWQDEGELDLVFNWNGKLWVVDCKHRRGAESRVGRLREVLGSTGGLSPAVAELLDQITGELREKELKPLKEDLLTVAEAGGLLGQAVVVRVRQLPAEAVEFARSRRLPVVLRHDLCEGLRALLHPHQPATTESLRLLASARTRAG
jgi:hypothetical protein